MQRALTTRIITRTTTTTIVANNDSGNHGIHINHLLGCAATDDEDAFNNAAHSCKSRPGSDNNKINTQHANRSRSSIASRFIQLDFHPADQRGGVSRCSSHTGHALLLPSGIDCGVCLFGLVCVYCVRMCNAQTLHENTSSSPALRQFLEHTSTMVPWFSSWPCSPPICAVSLNLTSLGLQRQGGDFLEEKINTLGRSSRHRDTHSTSISTSTHSRAYTGKSTHSTAQQAAHGGEYV